LVRINAEAPLAWSVVDLSCKYNKSLQQVEQELRASNKPTAFGHVQDKILFTWYDKLRTKSCCTLYYYNKSTQ